MSSGSSNFFQQHSNVYQMGPDPTALSDEGEEEEEEEQEESGEEYGAPPDIEALRRELGEPVERSECFGCRYAGENDQAAIPYERLREVIQVITQGIGRTCPIALAKEAAAMYEDVRRDLDGTIPEWDAASIHEHFYNHNVDPQIQQWIQLDRLRTLMRIQEEESLVVVDRKTKKRRIDKEQAAIYNANQKMYWAIAGKDPRKMAFFNESLHLDEGGGGGGGSVIDTQTKPIYEFFKRRKRQRDDC